VSYDFRRISILQELTIHLRKIALTTISAAIMAGSAWWYWMVPHGQLYLDLDHKRSDSSDRLRYCVYRERPFQPDRELDCDEDRDFADFTLRMRQAQEKAEQQFRKQQEFERAGGMAKFLEEFEKKKARK
jgi:hypothetical protein